MYTCFYCGVLQRTNEGVCDRCSGSLKRAEKFAVPLEKQSVHGYGPVTVTSSFPAPRAVGLWSPRMAAYDDA